MFQQAGDWRGIRHARQLMGHLAGARGPNRHLGHTRCPRHEMAWPVIFSARGFGNPSRGLRHRAHTTCRTAPPGGKVRGSVTQLLGTPRLLQRPRTEHHPQRCRRPGTRRSRCTLTTGGNGGLKCDLARRSTPT
jgi:hypothetical protein